MPLPESSGPAPRHPGWRLHRGAPSLARPHLAGKGAAGGPQPRGGTPAPALRTQQLLTFYEVMAYILLFTDAAWSHRQPIQPSGYDRPISKWD
jgi:hypothetical protein